MHQMAALGASIQILRPRLIDKCDRTCAVSIYSPGLVGGGGSVAWLESVQNQPRPSQREQPMRQHIVEVQEQDHNSGTQMYSVVY